MIRYRGTFHLAVLTPDQLLYENDVESVFLIGDQGEYELLAYHYPVIGVLKEGHIIIDWREAIPINFGIVRFFANDCIILVQERDRFKPKLTKTEDDIVVESDDTRHFV